jgi:hypothetical protein
MWLMSSLVPHDLHCAVSLEPGPQIRLVCCGSVRRRGEAVALSAVLNLLDLWGEYKVEESRRLHCGIGMEWSEVGWTLWTEDPDRVSVEVKVEAGAKVSL